MIELDHVTKVYGGRRVVDSVCLSIRRGETLVLIGPSGCGKSTLLRLMLGLVSRDEGRIVFDGQPVNGAQWRDRRRRTGYVIQDGGLFPHLTAAGNITLLARHLKWPRERISGRLGELASLTSFPTDGLDRYPEELSGGQRQRVALMRALMLDPDVLLLDEPLGALDPMVRSDLQEDLRTVFRKLKKTTVLVTHDLAEAEYFADRLCLMRAGTIVQCASPQQVTAAPASRFVTEFFRAQRRVLATPAREAL